MKRGQLRMLSLLGLVVAPAAACSGGGAGADADPCAADPGLVLRLTSAPAPFDCGNPPNFDRIEVVLDVGAGHAQQQFQSGPSAFFVPWPTAAVSGAGQVLVTSSGPGDCSGSGMLSFTADVATCQEITVELQCSCGAPDAGP